MENSQIIERVGGLIKEEPLSSMDNDTIVKDTWVLEAIDPFFGYYNDGHEVNKKPYFYFVLDECPSFEGIMRITHNIRQKVNYDFDAAPGSVYLFKTTFPVIRIRGIDHYCRIKNLQELYLNHGIQFKKSNRKVSEQMTLIRTDKFFYLKPVGQGLFLDNIQEEKGYFTLPGYVDWEEFKKLTTEARYDTSLLFFDAAHAYFYENGKITDLVRIFKEQLTVEKLMAIRDRYWKLLE